MFAHHAPSLDIAAIALSFYLLLDGFKAEQTFVAQYDPDIIISASDAAGTADWHVVLDRLGLESNFSLHAISLPLKGPCLLWGPQQRPMAAKVGSESALEAAHRTC